jgi:hypothetical protein
MKLRYQNTEYLTTRSGKRYTRSSKNRMKKRKLKKNKPFKFTYFEMVENPKFKLVKEEELFKIWMKKVDSLVYKTCGIPRLDFPDLPFYDSFLDGYTPKQMLQEFTL